MEGISSCGCLLWHYNELNADPYPNGEYWIDGAIQDEVDALFIEWRTELAYGASLPNTVTFTADGTIAENTTRVFTLQTPASINLDKPPFSATVNANSATVTVTIGPSVGGFFQLLGHVGHRKFRELLVGRG